MHGLPIKNSRKPFPILLVLSFLLSLSFSSYAYEPTDEKVVKKDTAAKKETFDAGKLIIEHISDSYGWHMWGEGHHAVSIPLPVILYSDKGLDIFMSSAFHHGEEDVQGKYTYRLEENHIKVVENGVVNEEATAKLT